MARSETELHSLENLHNGVRMLTIEMLQARRELLTRKYDPAQPRLPAGASGGGRWVHDGGAGSERESDANKPGPSQIASRRISRSREAFYEDQFRRDTFHCRMVGLASCYSQAALRYANCLAGLQIPPLNY